MKVGDLVKWKGKYGIHENLMGIVVSFKTTVNPYCDGFEITSPVVKWFGAVTRTETQQRRYLEVICN